MSDSTEKPNFDLNVLQSRIDQIKQEGIESSQFIHNYINCLMARHHLVDCITDDTIIPDIPDSYLKSIQNNRAPTVDEIQLLSDEDKSWFIVQLVWICGMSAVSAFCETDESHEDYNTFDIILSMMEVSEAHYVGCYLICALMLLMGTLPEFSLIEHITDNFNNDPEKIDKCKEVFYQLYGAIYTRYVEDVSHYKVVD